MRYSFVADHFQYLASLGPIVLACAWATRAATRLAEISPPARRGTRAVAAAILLLLAGRTLARCRVYADEETLWRDTLARNQDAWIAHNNLGILLAQQGRNADAAEHFLRVLALRPEHTGALANLGYAQELMGRDADAATTLERAAVARPGDADARTHLVRTLLRLNRPNEALPYALEAATLRPNDADALADAGSLLARAGRSAEGIPLLERAVALRPGFARAAANLELARKSATSAGLRYPPAPASPTAPKETAR
jgi:Flp pilus assembly protein TadD